MSVGAIVQVRMNSSRLPGKVLHCIQKKPMLQYLLEKLDRCQELDKIIVATSKESTDDPIADFCERYAVDCYRGDLNNVASRFKDIIEKYSFDLVVRICGDSPLLDISLIKTGLNIIENGDFDFVTNVQSRTFPKGHSVEIIYGETFNRFFRGISDPEDLEHVTRYFYRQSNKVRIGSFSSGGDWGDVQHSVDTLEDMDRFKGIVGKMNKPHWLYSWQEILEIENSYDN
jgi:spore coat polysaccharide biosynthesis protein SpsF